MRTIDVNLAWPDRTGVASRDMDRRIVLEVLGVAFGLLLVAFNLAAMRRIWTTPELERPQRIAQTILVWLLPGAFVAVRYELDPPPEPANDPTVSKVADNGSHAAGARHL